MYYQIDTSVSRKPGSDFGVLAPASRYHHSTVRGVVPIVALVEEASTS